MLRTMTMWVAMIATCGVAACEVDPGAVEAGVARPVSLPPGPAVTVTPRSTGELAVSWTSLSVASYSVLRGVGGGTPAMVATVGAPTTSYIDSDLAAGSTYCYQVVGVFEGGATTAASASACASAGGAGGSSSSELDIPAAAWRATSASTNGPTLSEDGVWSFDPGAANGLVAWLPVPGTARITSLRVHLKRNNNLHPSVGVITATLYGRRPGGTDTILSASAGPSVGTDWVTLDLVPVGQAASASHRGLWLSLATANFFGAGDPSPLFDTAVLIYSM